MERILLYIDEKTRSKKIVDLALRIAKALESRVYILYILYPKKIEDSAKKLGRKLEDVHSEMEEAGWSWLYQIEDEAFEKEIKVSLFLEEGESLALINSMVESYEIDLVVLGVDSEINLERMIKESKASLVLVK